MVKRDVSALSGAACAAEYAFSIVMPTYRRPHTIYQTVRTILDQTHTNWELIVVDNAGDADYRFDDPRIRQYRHAEQTSAAYARNCGLRYATGDLVSFFDDDDLMLPGYLEGFARAFATHPSASMVRCGMVQKSGEIDFSMATPECCLRRRYATPTWEPSGQVQDQEYFAAIVRANGWSEANGDIVVIEQPLCHAQTHPIGGLRAGRF
jgi:glycosyltransferase involved in cell wall biosynthesis